MGRSKQLSRRSSLGPMIFSKSPSNQTACCWLSSARSRRRSCGARTRSCGCAPGASRGEVDVRVVASSDRELGGEISAGRFREDLFYRLSVVPIRLPPLRDRREDIPLMARHFMARASEAARLTPREFGEDAMAALQAYTWPGNVRQLRNVIDWPVIMAPGDARGQVRADMLPTQVQAT